MRIVLAHDWLCGFRGGEAVLDRLARLLEADGHEIAALLVMFDDGGPLTEAIDRLPRRAAWVNGVPGSARLRRWLLPCYPSAVGHLSRVLAKIHREKPVDLVISTSSAAIKGLAAPGGEGGASDLVDGGGGGVPHLCYCHAPARYVWSQRAEYGGGDRGSLRGLGLRLYGGRFRAWDKRTSANVMRFVANSSHTAAEIQRCYERESDVVFPPVRTDFFNLEAAQPSGERGDFWLIVSALEPYKRVDLAISAAQRARRKLVIVGSGSQREHLGKVAFSGVEFRERVSDEELRELYGTAEALVFPQVEDFGIVAVEAQACGCPVIARRAGGALDSVIEGVTGAFFDKPSAVAIVDAAMRLPRDCERACRENAQRFAPERFDEGMRAAIRSVMSGR